MRLSGSGDTLCRSQKNSTCIHTIALGLDDIKQKPGSSTFFMYCMESGHSCIDNTQHTVYVNSWPDNFRNLLSQQEYLTCLSIF